MPTENELIGITAAAAALIGVVLYTNTGVKDRHQVVEDQIKQKLEDSLNQECEDLRRDRDDLDEHYQAILGYFVDHGGEATNITQLQQKVDQKVREKLMNEWTNLVTKFNRFKIAVVGFTELAKHHNYEIGNETQQWNELISKLNNQMGVWSVGMTNIQNVYNQQQNLYHTDQHQYSDNKQQFVHNHHHMHQNLQQNLTQNRLVQQAYDNRKVIVQPNQYPSDRAASNVPGQSKATPASMGRTESRVPFVNDSTSYENPSLPLAYGPLADVDEEGEGQVDTDLFTGVVKSRDQPGSEPLYLMPPPADNPNPGAVVPYEASNNFQNKPVKKLKSSTDSQENDFVGTRPQRKFRDEANTLEDDKRQKRRDASKEQSKQQREQLMAMNRDKAAAKSLGFTTPAVGGRIQSRIKDTPAMYPPPPAPPMAPGGLLAPKMDPVGVIVSELMSGYNPSPKGLRTQSRTGMAIDTVEPGETVSKLLQPNFTQFRDAGDNMDLI